MISERGRHCQSLDSDMLANNETTVIDDICESRAIRMLVDIRTEFSVITGGRILAPLLLYSSKRASESVTPVQTHEPEFPWSPSTGRCGNDRARPRRRGLVAAKGKGRRS